MALFKIFNNIDSKNTTLPNTYTKGYMYYDAKDSIFYIDIAGDGGETGIRQKINAWGAEKTLKDSLNQQIDTTYVKNIVISNNELSFITGDNIQHSVSGTLGAVTGVKGNAEQNYHIGQINLTPSNIGLGNAKIFYGICNSSSNNPVKEVNCDDFSLSTDNILYVKFNNTNTADMAQLTLNVANTGNKNIININAEDTFIDNMLYQFIYDGTNWVYIKNAQVNTGEAVEVVRLI